MPLNTHRGRCFEGFEEGGRLNGHHIVKGGRFYHDLLRSNEQREVKEKEKEKAFSALRDALGVGVAGVGVACRAWLGVGLVVVVAMSLSLFTERAG